MVSPLLTFICLSRGDQTDHTATRRVRHHKYAPFDVANGNPPLFAVIATIIQSIQALIIEKYASGVLERHSVFRHIVRRFRFVPFELHSSL
jgi:hypothetical protein